jgi:hypothetical protein
MDEIYELYANLVFKANINNSKLPFEELHNPENLRKKRIVPLSEEWGSYEALQPSGIPFQSFKFENDVIFNITPDILEIKQDGSGEKNTPVSIRYLIESSKKLPNYVSAYDISNVGINYQFIIRCSDAKEKLVQKNNTFNSNDLDEINYRLVYNMTNESDKLIVDIFSGKAVFFASPNDEINGITVGCNFNRVINTETRFPRIDDFIENIESYFETARSKALAVIEEIFSQNT